MDATAPAHHLAGLDGFEHASIVLRQRCGRCGGSGESSISSPATRNPCPVCDGARVEEDELPLGTFIEALLSVVDAPLVPPAELDRVVSDVRETLVRAASESKGAADDSLGAHWLRITREAAETLHALARLTRGES